MFTPELACVDFQECSQLPPSTLVATVSILRELRCALGPTKLNLIIGDQAAVLVSSDLYAAFLAWEEQLGEETGGGSDDTVWLN